MPRLDPLPAKRVGLLKRLAYRYARRSYGQIPEPVAVWAHAPGVFWSQSLYETMVHHTWQRLPAKLRALATLRAAAVIGCPWCLDFGTLIARHGGVTEPQLRALHRWADTDLFDDREQLVLAYADAMTAQPMTVTDEMVERLRVRFTDAEVVELTALIALENQRSRFNHALGITAQGFAAGDCALPAADVEVSASTAAG